MKLILSIEVEDDLDAKEIGDFLAEDILLSYGLIGVVYVGSIK